jgi:transposase
MSKVRFLGLDVHADTLAVAVAEPDGEVRFIGTFPNRLESIRKIISKLGPAGQLRACYEAGPTGYVLYWQLTALGVACEVIAPTLVPTKAGDRVKTDRRDARIIAGLCVFSWRPARPLRSAIVLKSPLCRSATTSLGIRVVHMSRFRYPLPHRSYNGCLYLKFQSNPILVG